MLDKHPNCKCKKKAFARPTTLNRGKARFAESLNNYNTLREAIEHQFVARSPMKAANQRRKFEIA